MLDPHKSVRGIRTTFTLLFSITILASITVLFTGCSEDESKDVVPPQVSFTTLANESTVFGEVSIAADANDEKGLEKVDIYIDGVLTTTITQLPFEFSWDSNTVADGTHTIKAVATDKTGNVAETEIKVTVKNILVSVKIPSDQLYSDEDYLERGFVFLSDENGKVIASAEYKNGEEVILKNQDFKGDKFYFTEVIDEDSGTESHEITARTFAQVERGTNWILIAFPSDDRIYVGEATINCSNLKNADAEYRLASTGDQAYININKLTTIINLGSSPSDLYVTLYNPVTELPSHFGVFNDIKIGMANAVDLSKVSKPLTSVTVTTPIDKGYVSVDITGYSVANTYTNGIDFPYFSGEGGLTYCYPGTTFPAYYSEVYWNAGDFYYSRGSRDKLFEIKMLENNVTFTQDGTKLTYTAKGDFDLMSYAFGGDDNYWSFVVEKGENKLVPALEVPAILKDFDLPAFSSPSGYLVYDFEEIEDYADFVTYYNSTRYSFHKLYDDGKNFIDIQYFLDDKGGRKSQSDSKRHFGRVRDRKNK